MSSHLIHCQGKMMVSHSDVFEWQLFQGRLRVEKATEYDQEE